MAAGFRSPQFPLGLSALPPGPVQGGYRSLLAFWLGGASSGEEVPPIPPSGGAGGWGRVRLPEYEIRLRHHIFGDNFTPEEQEAILAAIAWVLK